MRIPIIPSGAASISRSLTLLCAALPAALAVSFQAAPSPNLDLSGLGRVGVAGDFDSISLYQYASQSEDFFNVNGSQGVLAQLPNGVFTTLAMSDAYIFDMCPFVMKDGTLAGVVVAGNFTSLGGVQSPGVALFNPSTSEVAPLTGINGSVYALLCDQETNSVYVGGDFRASVSTNAIAWYGTSGWSDLPFAGFNGPVTSIVRESNGKVVFGGRFDGLGNLTAPQNRDQQVINLSTASISATGSSSDAGFSNPRNIVCKNSGAGGSGNAWLLADNQPGSWRAEFGFGFIPTKLRLWNANQDGRGTKTFRFINGPTGGILELGYTDSSGNNHTCTNQCPLSNDPNTPFQDFRLLQYVGMNGFEIAISEWYGAGGGFNSIELFQDDIYAFSINNFNEPSCGTSEFRSTASSNGLWTATPSSSGSDSAYLTTTVNSGNASSASIVYSPDIKQSGNYSVSVYTPGCIGDGTCQTRGRVTLRGTLASGTRASSANFTSETFQTNNFEKYDEIYYGYVEAASGSFRPTVTLTPSPNQGDITVVGQKVRFQLISTTESGLNGIFEFDPNVVEQTNNFTGSAIDVIGNDLGGSADVVAMIEDTTGIYVGGSFSSDAFSNIFVISDNKSVALANKGVDNSVLAMYLNSSKLYAGGNFTKTGDGSVLLNNVGVYDIAGKKWSSLGNGVNGRVCGVVGLPMNVSGNTPELVIALSGDFNQINAFASNSSVSVNGFAIWVPAKNNWLPNLSVRQASMSGRLSSSIVANGTNLYSGTIASQGLAVSGAAALTTGDSLGINPFPIKFMSTKSNSTSRKRAVIGDNAQGVFAGLYYNQNNHNVTILGGDFVAQATDGSTVNSLAIIDGSNGDRVAGTGNAIAADSSVYALAWSGDFVLAGGKLTGSVPGGAANGLVVYNVAKKAVADPQPAFLHGSNVAVNALASRPNTDDVYVAGNFESAGSLSCPSVCVYSTSQSQWNRPGSGLGGIVYSAFWADKNTLYVGGEVTINNTYVGVAKFDANSGIWSAVSAGHFPLGINRLAPSDLSSSSLFATGTDPNNNRDYILLFTNNTVYNIGAGLDSVSKIKSIQLLSVQNDHASTYAIQKSRSLLLTGALSLPGHGNVSAALYNGTSYAPFLLSNRNSGESGTLYTFFSSNSNTFSSGRKPLAVGFVVLISLALALALVFLIVVFGILISYLRRKREGYSVMPSLKHDDMRQRLPPEQLFSGLNNGNGVHRNERVPHI